LLTLRTLGSLTLRDSAGNEIATILSQPKRCALLVYLAVASPRGLHRRDTLLSLFWPERDDAHGRNALSQGLSYLRRNLSANVIIGRGPEEVGLASDTIRTDVEDFESAIEDGRWADALDLYGGDFLRGFHVGDAWGFGEWLEAERERLKEAAAGAGWTLAQEQIKGGALVNAERTGQRALSLVWSDETPVREFIQSLAGAGDRAAAIRFYEKFRARLRDELELEPSQKTIEVAEAIRNGGLSTDLPGTDTPPSPVTSPGHLEPSGQYSESPADLSPAPDVPLSTGPWKLWFWSLAFAAIVCFAIVGIYRIGWSLSASGPPSPDRPFTVLAAVTGGADEDERETVGFLLRSSLDMAHVVQTVPLTEVARILRLMEKEPGTPLDPALAREVAVRLGVPTVVIPRLDHLGEQYLLALRVEDVQEGLLRAEGRGLSEAETDAVQMVDDVARDVRRKLGESRGVLANTGRLPQVLTPSLEALKKYRASLSYSSQAQVFDSRTLLWEAVALDTAFAMAWQRLSDVYLTFPADNDSSAFAAWEVQRFRHRLTEARWADIQLHLRILDDVALWDEALRDAGRAVLQDRTWIGYYALRMAHEAGLPDSAWSIYVEQERRGAADARRFDRERPYSIPCNSHELIWSVSLDRTAEWMTLLDSLQAEIPTDCGRDLAFYESQANGDWDLADSVLAANQGGWRWPARVEWTARQLPAVRGRIGAAHELLGPNDDDPFGVDQTQRTRLSHLFLDLVFGLPPHELAEDLQPMELRGRGKFPVVDFILHGVNQGLLGDTLRSQRVVRRLEAMRDSSTSRTFERSFEPWFVLLDAAPAYRRNDWPYIISQLEPMVGRIHEPGVGGYLPGSAYLSWWLLAEAHHHLGQSLSAISYLEAFFQRPRARLDDWTFHGFFRPTARLKLGRLYAEVNDAERAREHYQAFLDTFTDPDPEYEWMVEQAREGLAALGG